MKDKLEDFIRKNRQGFDTKVPKSDLWNHIKAELDEDEKSTDYSWIWKVAAVVFLVSTIGLIVKNNFNEGSDIELADNKGYNSELVEVENYYTQLISEKKNEIMAADVQNSELLRDMNVLDSMYIELKNDLKLNQEDNRLMNAMIRNLQLRVEILNKQLNILEHIQKVKNDENISI